MNAVRSQMREKKIKDTVTKKVTIHHHTEK